MASVRRKLGAGASRSEDVDEAFSLLVPVWVGGWGGRGFTRNRPYISPQLAERDVLVESGTPFQPLGLSGLLRHMLRACHHVL